MFGKAKTKEVYKISIRLSCHCKVYLYTYHSMCRLKLSQNIANEIKVTLAYIHPHYREYHMRSLGDSLHLWKTICLICDEKALFKQILSLYFCPLSRSIPRGKSILLSPKFLPLQIGIEIKSL